MNSKYRGSLSSAEARDLHSKGLLRQAMREGYLPVMAGGSPTSYADPIYNPLTGPTISGTTITVDFLLNNPTVIRREVADRVMQNFFLDKVFTMGGGGVMGGAILYDQPTTVDVYTDRDVERVAPGAEAPILTGARIVPLVQPVEKFMAKFAVTDEAKNRNDGRVVRRQMRRMANTITRKMQQRALAELEAAISAFSLTQAAPEAKSWLEATKEARLSVVPAKSPLSVVLKAQEAQENREMGEPYDTIILNPKERRLLLEYFGTEAGRVQAALESVGITTMISTPRKTAKSAILCAGGEVGEIRFEEPMRTESEREGAPLLRQQTWIQSSVNPIVVVDNPYAVVELTELS